MIKEKLKKLFMNKTSSSDDSDGRRFKRNNNLIAEKIFEYIPAMFLSNLSTLLLISVDGIVVGIFVADKDLSLSAINVFYPASLMISVFVALLAFGISTALSTSIGNLDYEKLNLVKNAMKFLLAVAFVFIAIIQIPMVFLVLKAYNLSPDLYNLALKYGIGIMILNPFSIISTVGVYQLQILGKAKVVMYLSIFEGILNVILDLLFTAYLGFGITGVAMGTAISGIIRAIITFIYLIKKTDLYRSENNIVRIAEIKEILTLGTPEAAYSIALSFKSFVMMKIILIAFGNNGGVINGVCNFCYNLSNVLVAGVVASMRPLVGFLEGAGDSFGLKAVMKTGTKIMVVLVSIIIIVVQLNPKLFFDLHGVDDINVTYDAIMSLRLYSIYFILAGLNNVLRLYLTNKKDVKFLSVVTLASYLLLPTFAYIFYKSFYPPVVWLASSAVAFIAMTWYMIRYKHFEKTSLLKDINYENEKVQVVPKKIDYNKLKKDISERILNMSVRPEEAVDASRYIRKYAMDKKFSELIANKMSLCMEEMVAYSVKAQKKHAINNQIIIRFYKDSGVFMMYDDGENIAFNKDTESKEMTIDNYTLLKKLAKSYKYQYILNMNHTLLEF